MRLYLSSYQLGDRADLLVSMVRGGRRGGVIANALDGGDQERRAADTRRHIASLAELGREAADLDLREHDSSCDPIEDCLATYGEVRYDGLGVLDRAVVPHLRSPGHPETELLGEVAARYDAERTPYWALRDGQSLRGRRCPGDPVRSAVRGRRSAGDPARRDRTPPPVLTTRGSPQAPRDLFNRGRTPGTAAPAGGWHPATGRSSRP